MLNLFKHICYSKGYNRSQYNNISWSGDGWFHLKGTHQ